MFYNLVKNVEKIFKKENYLQNIRNIWEVNSKACIHKEYVLEKKSISNLFGLIYIALLKMWFCVGEQLVYVAFVDILDPVCYELTKASTTLADETKFAINQVTHTPAYVYNELFVLRGTATPDVSSTHSDM